MNPENKDLINPNPISTPGGTAHPLSVGLGGPVPLEEAPHLSAVTGKPALPPLESDQEEIPKPESEKQSATNWRSVVSTILLFLLAPIIALSITAFAFQSYQVDGESMETTLQNNDRLIVDKIPRTVSRITSHPYVPPRGDIIIFNQAGLFDSPTGEKQLIKRVIGLPGDRVFIKDGIITIYNRANPGGFNPDRSGLYTIAANNTSGDVNVTLQKNEIFVCGDNRSNSEDSRAFGPVNVNNIVGKLTLRILPISKAQSF
jgi:signal peptidase I